MNKDYDDVSRKGIFQCIPWVRTIYMHMLRSMKRWCLQSKNRPHKQFPTGYSSRVLFITNLLSVKLRTIIFICLYIFVNERTEIKFIEIYQVN